MHGAETTGTRGFVLLQSGSKADVERFFSLNPDSAWARQLMESRLRSEERGLSTVDKWKIAAGRIADANRAAAILGDLGSVTSAELKAAATKK